MLGSFAFIAIIFLPFPNFQAQEFSILPLFALKLYVFAVYVRLPPFKVDL